MHDVWQPSLTDPGKHGCSDSAVEVLCLASQMSGRGACVCPGNLMGQLGRLSGCDMTSLSARSAPARPGPFPPAFDLDGDLVFVSGVQHADRCWLVVSPVHPDHGVRITGVQLLSMTSVPSRSSPKLPGTAVHTVCTEHGPRKLGWSVTADFESQPLVMAHHVRMMSTPEPSTVS